MGLLEIQQKLKAPKNQYNSFGKYKYRSCEDILEALKPLLAENECTLIITDKIIAVGGWVYVRATVELYDKDDKLLVRTQAFAREPESRKGMDASQITGTASSYARKYALNGMFLIDDTKDADTMKPEVEKKEPPKQPVEQKKPVEDKTEKITPAQLKKLNTMLTELGWNTKETRERSEVLAVLKVTSLKDVSKFVSKFTFDNWDRFVDKVNAKLGG